jgi:hypothetical protein
MVLPRDLLIFGLPSVPGRTGKRLARYAGSGKTEPYFAADHQDVGRLQHRIVEQPERGFQLQVADLLLECWNSLRAGHADQHGEQQEQFGHFRNK